MSQMEIGKEVNEIEGHEREAEDNTYPFLTSFALNFKKSIRISTTHSRTADFSDKIFNHIFKRLQSTVAELDLTPSNPKQNNQRLVN